MIANNNTPKWYPPKDPAISRGVNDALKLMQDNIYALRDGQSEIAANINSITTNVSNLSGIVKTLSPSNATSSSNNAGGGSGPAVRNPPTLEINGNLASSQTLQNLIQGSNITITDGGNGNITFAANAAGFANPMTTLGDMITGNNNGVPQRLGVGSNNQVLTVLTGVPAWANATGGNGFANPMTTLGDIIVGGNNGTPARLGVGANGKVVTANSGATDGIDWEAPIQITTTGSSGSATLTAGNPYILNIPVYTSGGGGGSSCPALASFAWFNQGSSTTTQTVSNGPILLNVPNTSGTLNWRGMSIAMPSTPCKLQVQLRVNPSSFSNSIAAGIYFYDGTKLMGIEQLTQTSGHAIRIERITNVTTDNSTATTYAASSTVNGFTPFYNSLWWQLRDDGSTIFFDWSADGVNYINMWSEAVGSFITPTKWGFGGISITSSGSDFVRDWVEVFQTFNNANL